MNTKAEIIKEIIATAKKEKATKLSIIDQINLEYTKTLTGHSDYVRSVSISADSKYIASDINNSNNSSSHKE